MNKLEIVEVIENLAIQYLEELKVEYGGPVVIDSYEDEIGLYYTIVFNVDVTFEEASELYWDFLGLLIYRDLDAEYIFVNFIGKGNEEE